MTSEHTPPTQKAGTRRQPPDRRRSETRRIVWRAPNGTGPDTRIFVTIGYAQDCLRPERGLRPVEIFYNEGYRSGSDLEMLISDIHCLGRVCSQARERGILLSIMMQHEDVEIGAFTKSLAREQDLRSGDMRFASVVGVLVEELQRPPEWAAAVLAAQEASDNAENRNCKEEKPAGKASEQTSGEDAP